MFDPATNTQIGLVSWGRGCSTYGHPSVFGRVSAAADWAHEVICENTCYPDPEICTNTSAYHPCALLGPNETLATSGNGAVNLTIISDYFPGDIAFLLRHVEYKLEIYFQPYETYSYEDVADLDYGEDFIIQHIFEGLPNGTYHLALHDSDYDGICYGYSTCYGQENVLLGIPGSNESFWTDDGNYYGGLDIYFYVDENGTIAWVSENEEGTPAPTISPAPTAAPVYVPNDVDYPGDYAETTYELILNVEYDSYISETSWYFQRLGPEKAPTTAVFAEENDPETKTHDDDDAAMMERTEGDINEWFTIEQGPYGKEYSTLYPYHYNMSNLQPETLYRLQFYDSFG